MHELPITENILEITLRHAKQASAQRVTDIYLVIGQLSSIVDDSIQFYWQIVANETLAQEAVLHFRRVPVELLCLDCQVRYAPAEKDYACPECQGTRIKVVAGEEFFLEAINIE